MTTYEYYTDCVKENDLTIVFMYDNKQENIKGTLLHWGKKKDIENTYQAYLILGSMGGVFGEPIIASYPKDFNLEEFDKMRSTTGYVGLWWENYSKKDS